MRTRLILTGLAAVLAASTANAVNDKIELMPGGVICGKGDQVCYDQRGAKCSIPNRVCKHDQGEGERAKKITKLLFETPAPAPR